MNQPGSQTCPECHQLISQTSRYCSYCGAPVGAARDDAPEDEIVVAGGKRLRVSPDTLNLRALLAMVEASVAWWQRQLQDADNVDRERAAAAIQNLSRILESLAAQLAQGRETMRITTRLPTPRRFSTTCPVCGHGNRAEARFCRVCGALLANPAPQVNERPGQDVLRAATATCTDPGKARSHNEDSCYAGTLPLNSALPVLLLLVADGMGGSQAGEEASRRASAATRQALVDELYERRPASDAEWQDLLRRVVLVANQHVYQGSRDDPAFAGMGTTLTVLVVERMQAHVAHVGDSRAYLFNAAGATEDGAGFWQMTTDHSLVARLVDIGHLSPAEARTHPQRNIIYRSLGRQPDIDVDTSSHPLEVGDALLLCSDGLTIHLEDTELAQVVLQNRDPEHICTTLVDRANQAGGHDNISVVIAMATGKDHVRV
jgi:protein phosphatase